MSEELLVDRVRKACMDPDRRMYGHTAVRRLSSRAASASDRHVRRFGSILSGARAFYLDAAVTELVARMSARPALDLSAMLPLARPPHQTTWIEWDEVVRVRQLAALGLSRDPGDGDSGHVGMLLETLDRGGDTPVYRVSVATELLGSEANEAGDRHPEAVTLMPIGFLYDPTSAQLSDRLTPQERQLNQEISKLEVVRTKGDETPRFVPRLYAVGGAWSQRALVDADQAEARQALADKVRYFAVGGTAVLLNEVEASLRKPEAEAERQRMVRRILEQGAGDFRTLVAILALLNTRPAIQSDVRAAPGVRMEVRGRRLPYLERHTVRLSVPKTRAETLIEQRISEGRPRRAHEVRGTMCHSRDLSSRCRHSWSREPRGVERCAICGGRRWWRRPHMRGDARLGFVEKDYRVEARSDASGGYGDGLR